MRIGCGCVNLGSASSSGSWDDHVRLLRMALDAGVTLLDTADAYSGGLSERIIAQAVRGRRHEVTIATKGGYVFRERSRGEQQLRRIVSRSRSRRAAPVVTTGHARSASNYAEQDFSPTSLRRSLEASLRRLDVDHIDVYQLHGPDTLPVEAIEELVRARDAGKIGRIGVGAESVTSAGEAKRHEDIGVVQLPFGILDTEALSVFRDDSTGRTPSFWARGVLGGGVLAAAMTGTSMLDHHPKRGLVLELQEIAEDAAIQVDELALRWVAGHPEITSTMVGISSPDHLHRNIDLAARGPLDSEVAAAVAAAHQRHRGVMEES